MIAHSKKEWFDNDALWIELYQYMFSERRFVEASDQAPRIVKLTQPLGNAVLDL